MAILATSPAGDIEPVQNLKRRKLARYWRPHPQPDGSVEWIETLPLPADPNSKEMYLGKGFKLIHPSQEQATVDAEKQALLEENARLKAQLEQVAPHQEVAPLYVKVQDDTVVKRHRK